jgi:glycerophosphoryl diester phosphodiesterase
MKMTFISLIINLTAGLSGAERPMIVAHRGASRDAPENTIPAFKLAWKQEADAIEGDFHLTRDGHIVCIHDKNTKRVSDRNLVVSKSTLDELRGLDVGEYFGKKYKGTVIPTIAEVFSTIPEKKKICIEIKCGSEIIDKLLREIGNSGLEPEQIVVISFNKTVIRDFKSKASKYKAFWLSGFRKDKSGKISPSLETVLQTLKQIKADGFSSSRDIPGESFIKGIQDQGYEYHVWTVDDPARARRFRKWGVSSITTNVPGLVRKYLTEKEP